MEICYKLVFVVVIQVEPFLDISAIYGYLRPNLSGRKSKNVNGLATICREVLGITLSKVCVLFYLFRNLFIFFGFWCFLSR